MTQPLSSHGTLLQLGASGGGGPYTTIAEVVDASGPSFEQAVHDAPSHRRPSRRPRGTRTRAKMRYMTSARGRSTGQPVGGYANWTTHPNNPAAVAPAAAK